MIATRRGLAIAGVLVVLLAVIVILDGDGARGPVDRSIATGVIAEQVTGLAWTGGRPVALVRTGARWSWVDPPGSADPATIDEVLAALRGARWHRRAERSAAGATTATLTVTTGASQLEIAIGQPVAGTEQQWLAIADRALLVDAWVARALVPDPLALRVRAPLAAAPGARRIRLSSGGTADPVTIEGAPRRIVAPFQLWLDPQVAATLERALAELVVTELPARPLAAARGWRITVDDVEVRDAGPCPGSTAGRWAIDGTLGPGCVDRPRWDELERTLGLFAAPVGQLVERRPLPFDPMKLVLPDRALLDLTAHPRIGDRDADPARVAELLAALAVPAEPVLLPAAPPTATITATGRAQQIVELDLYTAGVVARRGEPIALRLGDGAWKLVTRPSLELRDRTLWREEPTTITSLELDATTYTRGAVLGEWTRTGPGRDDPRGVEQLIAALAAPLGTPRPHASPARHIVKLHVAPVGGAPRLHTIELGDVEAGGCNAIVDREQIRIAASICALVRDLAR